MQGIRIGPIAFLSIQDEPFVEIGQRDRAPASPFAHTLFSGYSNGNFGYLPVRERVRGGRLRSVAYRSTRPMRRTSSWRKESGCCGTWPRIDSP